MNTNSTIPETGFASLNPQKDAAMIMMSFILADTLSLSSFSVIQLIKGVQEIAPKTMIQSEIAILMSKLFTSAVESNDDQCKVDISREDVVLLRKWLENRMRHCEAERDEENKQINKGLRTDSDRKFNPDSYIGMKLLLIELREWLLGEEVVDENVYNRKPQIDLNHLSSIPEDED